MIVRQTLFCTMEGEKYILDNEIQLSIYLMS